MPRVCWALGFRQGLLVVSERTFVRDFHRHYAAIETLKGDLSGSDLWRARLVRQLKARRARGD